MYTIRVWVYGRQNPLIYPDVEEYYDTRKALIIIQDTLYTTITTKIFKQCLQMYDVTQER